MRNQGVPFEKPSDPLGSFLKIFLAVFIAGMAIFAIRTAIAFWMIQQVGEGMQKSVAQIQERSQAQIAAIQERQQREQERIRQLKAVEAEHKRIELAEQAARMQHEAELAQAKEDAWLKFYKPRPECEELNSSRDFIECGNAYHRSKVEFEKMWQAKKQSMRYP